MKAFRDPIAWEGTLPIRPSSVAWRAVIKTLYGTPLEPDEAAIFAELSGGRPSPDGGADELLVVAGRRGGKSETIARVATFEAIHGGHGIALAPGQRGLIPVISPLREQSQEILGYARGLAALPAVKRHVEGEPTRDGISFKSGIAIRVMTADALNVSGPTVVCAIRDEWAKHPGDDAAVSDREIENSLRPALAPVEGAPRRRLIGITSAYIEEGLAYETDRDMFGRPDAPVLVVRGTTAQFNPNIDAAWLAKEQKRDERIFAREYLGQWQPAIQEGYFPASLVDACVDIGRTITPPRKGVFYCAAIDAAFRGDLFALAVTHREMRVGASPLTIVDGVWTWRGTKGEPLNVEETAMACAAIIRSYNGAHTFADQFALDPLKEAFRRYDVWLQEAPWTASTKPGKFSSVRAGMTTGLVRLPDDQALVREFCNIRARLLRSGGEQIEARVGTDDRVHAVVLSATESMRRSPDTREAVPEVMDEVERARREAAAHKEAVRLSVERSNRKRSFAEHVSRFLNNNR